MVVWRQIACRQCCVGFVEVCFHDSLLLLAPTKAPVSDCGCERVKCSKQIGASIDKKVSELFSLKGFFESEYLPAFRRRCRNDKRPIFATSCTWRSVTLLLMWSAFSTEGCAPVV